MPKLAYPTSCMSAYCGESSDSDYCKTCRNRPYLDAYREMAAKENRKINAPLVSKNTSDVIADAQRRVPRYNFGPQS